MMIAILMACALLAQEKLTLAHLEKMALERNPSLAQAAAAVRSAEGARRQAGLYPNPNVGYTASEVTPGPIISGGEHGGFVSQRIVTGGKLGIARRMADQEIAIAKAASQAERLRVLNQVRGLFYQALAEQRLLEVRGELAQLARRAVQTTNELANVGQADRPDVLAIEIEAQRLELGLVTARNALDRTWRRLAAATGNPDLARQPLEGDLEQLPELDFDQALRLIYQQSPDLDAARAGAARSELAVKQARAAVIPDLVARAGAHYNRERLELFQRRVGLQASMEVDVDLPLFNRNQGAIAAARADAERAGLSVNRTQLHLRARLAEAFREYQDSRAAAERYRKEMLPRAEQAYQMYASNFRQMAAAYPQVIIAQRNLFQLQEDYVTALGQAWQRVVEVQGLLVE